MFERIILSDFERSKFDELIESLGWLDDHKEIIDDFTLSVSLERTRIGFARACDILLNMLKHRAKEKSKNFRIENKELSDYEKEYLLTKYCFLKTYAVLPKWFLELY
ncbi:hypothetical protein [Helicobacter equorum]|uniref:hypothetical protein n=1 Tax=Helicobacter equorum TaxID=361872 RepID=UPI000CF0A2F2|nr:hypothetical protein [Helicobacter equorum]